MTNITFQEYLEDVLDLHEGLMGTEQIQEARKGYTVFTTPVAKVAKHQDAGLKLIELRNKVERFVFSANITIERNQGKDLTMVRTFAAKASTALQGRATKAALLDLITLNSDASRHLNSQGI